MSRKYLTVASTEDINKAIRTYCESQDPPEDVSDWIRVTLCKAIGKPKLAKQMRKRGKPKGTK